MNDENVGHLWALIVTHTTHRAKMDALRGNTGHSNMENNSNSSNVDSEKVGAKPSSTAVASLAKVGSLSSTGTGAPDSRVGEVAASDLQAKVSALEQQVSELQAKDAQRVHEAKRSFRVCCCCSRCCW